MKLTIQKDALLGALKKAKSIAKGAFIPEMVCVLMDADGTCLSLTATDGDRRLSTSALAITSKPGSALVPCDKLMAIVAHADGEITIEKSGDHNIKITAGDDHATIFGLPILGFPADDPRGDADSTFDAETGLLAREIARAAVAALPNNSRPFINGVHIGSCDDGMKIEGTDGHRIHSATIAVMVGGKPVDITLPLDSARVIVDLFASYPTSCTTNGRRLFVENDEISFSTKLLESQYPNLAQAIPEKQSKKFTVKLDDILPALSYVSTLADNGNRSIWEVQKGGLKVSNTGSQTGETSKNVPAKSSDAVRFCVCSDYISDAMKACRKDEPIVEFSSPESAFVIRGDSFISVVMPMRIAGTTAEKS